MTIENISVLLSKLDNPSSFSVTEPIEIDENDRDILDKVLTLRRAFFSYREIAERLSISDSAVYNIVKKYDINGNLDNPLHFFHSRESRRFTKRVYFLHRIKRLQLGDIAEKLKVPIGKVRHAFYFMVNLECCFLTPEKYRAIGDSWIDYVINEANKAGGF